MGTDGHGTTVTFGTSGFSANLISVDGPSMERGSIDSTHMGTTAAHSKIPAALYDGGQVNLTIEHDGSDDPPIDQAVETIAIDWGGQGAGYIESFSGFMTNYSRNAAIGERMQATATLQVTGEVSQA